MIFPNKRMRLLLIYHSLGRLQCSALYNTSSVLLQSISKQITVELHLHFQRTNDDKCVASFFTFFISKNVDLGDSEEASFGHSKFALKAI